MTPLPLPPPPRRRARRLWLAGCAGVALVAVGVAGRASWHRFRSTMDRENCASHLHQIGLAILLYQQDHGGRYPASLAETAADEAVGTQCFVCPASGDVPSPGPTTRAVTADLDAGPVGGHCSYVYVGRGLTDRTVTPTTVVCYEPPTNHDGYGGNVLFGDGHADWQTNAGLARLLATTRAAP